MLLRAELRDAVHRSVRHDELEQRRSSAPDSAADSDPIEAADRPAHSKRKCVAFVRLRVMRNF